MMDSSDSDPPESQDSTRPESAALDLSFDEIESMIMRSHEEMDVRRHDPDSPDAPELLVRTWLFSIVKGFGIEGLWEISHPDLKVQLAHVWLENVPEGEDMFGSDVKALVDAFESDQRDSPIWFKFNQDMERFLGSLESLRDRHYGPFIPVARGTDAAIVDVPAPPQNPAENLRFVLLPDREPVEGNPWRVWWVSALEGSIEFDFDRGL